MLWLSFSYFTFGPIYHSLQSWLLAISELRRNLVTNNGRANTRASEGAAKPRERLTLQSLARTEETATLYVTVLFSFPFVLFCICEHFFPSISPLGAYIQRDDLPEGFLRYESVGLIFGGAYFRNSTVITVLDSKKLLTFWIICLF